MANAVGRLVVRDRGCKGKQKYESGNLKSGRSAFSTFRFPLSVFPRPRSGVAVALGGSLR